MSTASEMVAIGLAYIASVIAKFFIIRDNIKIHRDKPMSTLKIIMKSLMIFS